MRGTDTTPRALVLAVALVVLGASGCASSAGDAGDRPAGTAGQDTTSTSPPTTRGPRSFTLAAVGDILLHNYVITEGRQNAGGVGYDFDPMFAEVRDRISAADLAICHQETPISADDTDLTVPRTLSFNAPRGIAGSLRTAGFDACDTASNHTYDRGVQGVRETLDVLDFAGIGHAGSSRNAEEAANPPIYDVKGVKVGHLAYSYTIDNAGGPTTRVPPDAPWLRAMLWPAIGAEGIAADARRVRERGAEFVVVSMHWGDQYVRQPTSTQRQLARDLLASPDIDLILGDHVHVVQPCEQIDGEYVLYGMGNFLSNQSPSQDASLKPDTEDGTINTFTVREVSPGSFRAVAYEFTPTRVVIPSHRIVPATPDRYTASYARTVEAVNALNAGRPGSCDAKPSF